MDPRDAEIAVALAQRVQHVFDRPFVRWWLRQRKGWRLAVHALEVVLIAGGMIRAALLFEGALRWVLVGAFAYSLAFLAAGPFVLARVRDHAADAERRNAALVAGSR